MSIRHGTQPEPNRSIRVCHVTTVHDAADSRIYYRMCLPLRRKGLDVGLIAPDPICNDSPVRFSSWGKRIANAGRVGRVVLALRAVLAESPHIVHFHDPELILMGLILKIVRPSIVVVYDVHEDYPSMMAYKHWLPRVIRPIVSALAELANKTAGVFLDGIVTADPGVYADFQAVAKSKSMIYYNFPDLCMFSPPTPDDHTTRADIVYVGGMSARTGIHVLLDALSVLAGEGLKPTVRLAGYTEGEKGRVAIQKGIRARNLESQVFLKGLLPAEQVPDWIRTGRIGLVALQPVPKFMKNIPTKMFEYWACGLPVVASNLPPIKRFVEEGKNGVLFEPTDGADLARAIRLLMERPNDCKAMGQNGRNGVSTKFNNERQVDELIEFYNFLLKGNVYAVAAHH